LRDFLRKASAAVIIFGALLVVITIVASAMFSNKAPGTKAGFGKCDAGYDGDPICIILQITDVNATTGVVTGIISAQLNVNKYFEGIPGSIVTNAPATFTVAAGEAAPKGFRVTWNIDTYELGVLGWMPINSQEIEFTTERNSGSYPNERLLWDFIPRISATGPLKDLAADKPVVMVTRTQPINDWSLSRAEGPTKVFISAIHGARGVVDKSNNEPEVLATLAFERSHSYRAYIYAICSLPMLIALGFTYRRLANPENEADVTSPLELASALLASLTLRQVLVPADIEGLTVVDKLLGIELTLIVFLVLYNYIHPSPSGASSGAPNRRRNTSLKAFWSKSIKRTRQLLFAKPTKAIVSQSRSRRPKRNQ
jgi:hypothetical protein